MNSDSTNSRMFVLLIFSICCFALTYATTILLARALGANGYDDYAVAIATATILATLAEMGTGKYAMRAVPAYVEQQQWQQVKGFWRFSVKLIFAVSAILASIAILNEFAAGNPYGCYALEIVILFLPAIALVGFGAELAMAFHAPIRAAAVTRLLVPGTTLAVTAAWIASPLELSPSRATFCYATGWVVGLIAIFGLIRQTVPKQIPAVKATYKPKEWFTRSMPFLFFTLLISTLLKAGVIVLELVCPDEAEVAVFSIALDTGTCIFIVAKSTDKLFLPRLSMMIEQRDVAGIRHARRRRMTTMLGICAIYLAIIFVFGQAILSMFGSEFVHGYPALCIIAVTTSVWTAFSLAPTFLNYVNRNVFVVWATAISVVVNVVLCFVLGREYGAIGAAVAYAVPATLLYAVFAIAASRSLRKLDQWKDKDVADRTLVDLDAEGFSM